MWKAAIFLLLVIQYTVAQLPNPKVLDIDGYPLSWLRDPQPGTPPPISRAVPTAVPLRPLSMRIMYRVFDPSAAILTALDPIVVRGTGFTSVLNGVTNGVTVWLRFLEPTAKSCTDPNGWYAAPNPIPMAIYSEFTATLGSGQIPVPPRNMETPFEFMMPWICVCVTANINANTECGLPATGLVGDGNWVHTNMRYAYVQGCDGDTSTYPGIISNAHDPEWSPTGLTFDSRFLCATRAQLAGSLVGISLPLFEYGESSQLIPANTNGYPTYFDIIKNATVNSRLFLERRLRTSCCGWRGRTTTDPNNPTYVMKKRLGMCINPVLENCCTRTTPSIQGYQLNATGAYGGLGKPYSKFREKCCYGGVYDSSNEKNSNLPPQPVITSYLDDWCPCRSSQVQPMCNQQQPQPNNLLGVAATYGCCINSKYPEILYSSGSTGPLSSPSPSFFGAGNVAMYLNQIWGKCFDGTTMKCCDTGDLYDPGSKQCCKINGVQSINVPCPCSVDAHCGNNQTCCQDLTARMMFPSPATYDVITTQLNGVAFDACSKYANYPNGTGPYEVQPCIGQCIDVRFQICCNGMACIDEYEVCCNSTCCNKFSQRCAIGLRPGSRGQVSNRNDFHVYYEVCTSVEGMTPFRATLAYFLPLCLLAATFISLFSLLNFAKRQSSLQPLSIYEYAVFILSFVSVLLAWPLFFSPLYKYGIVWIWVQFFVMLAALSQLRLVNIGAVVMLGFLLNYVIDPFHGNELLTLASSRAPPPINSVFGYSGITHSVILHAPADYAACTAFYDYFHRDPGVEDQVRWDNPAKTTYGFCARGWLETLEVLTGLNVILTYVNFFVMLVTHLRNVLFEKAQKTDDIVQQPWYG